MLRHLAFSSCLIASAALAQDVQTVTIKTMPAQMRYDLAAIEVKPGAKVKLVFQNDDDMPHNIVFTQPGTDVVAMANKQMDKPEEALKRNWLPDDPRIWLHSRVLDPKTKQELEFTAPEKTGDYPYVCTMPAHAMNMRGVLRVVAEGPKLAGLKFDLYNGDWSKLPEFSKLTPHRSGEIKDGVITLKFDDYKNQYGLVFTGTLNAPKKGEYTFAITGDDGVRVLVDGKKVVEYDGIHPAGEIKVGTVKLDAGERQFRLEYFQGAGQAELFAAWAGPGFSMTPLTKWVPEGFSGAPKKTKKNDATGMPLAVAMEPVIYRNFISGAGNRGIGVGYPGNMNIAWSAESMSLALVWRGAFMDAAKHWRDRGGGAQPPLGYDAFRPGEMGPPFAVLAAGAEWPKLAKGGRAEDYTWRGYTLDAKRVPTFQYEWQGVKVSDRFDTVGDAVASAGKLVRTLKLDGNIPAAAVLRLATGTITPQGAAFLVDGGAFSTEGRQWDNKFIVSAEGARLEGKNLVVSAKAAITVTYTWPGGHAAHAH